VLIYAGLFEQQLGLGDLQPILPLFCCHHCVQMVAVTHRGISWWVSDICVT
jgi:hypothetical protein